MAPAAAGCRRRDSVGRSSRRPALHCECPAAAGGGELLVAEEALVLNCTASWPLATRQPRPRPPGSGRPGRELHPGRRARRHDAAGRLRGADLRNAIFNGAILQYTNFGDADLSGASFRDAELRGARFANTKVDGIQF